MTNQENQQHDDIRVGPWDDPNIPAGDAPPLPAWPAWITGAIWACWIVFLAVTALR